MEWKYFIEIMLLVLLIMVLIYNIIYIKSEGAKCLKNPTIYGMNVLSDYFNEEMSCICNAGVSINRTAIKKTLDDIYIPIKNNYLLNE